MIRAARAAKELGMGMLVLSRQRDETIMIGDDIEITVVDIRGDKVRLGINAPKSVQVHRKEVYLAIKRENERSMNVRPDDIAEVNQARPADGEPRRPAEIDDRPASKNPPDTGSGAGGG